LRRSWICSDQQSRDHRIGFADSPVGLHEGGQVAAPVFKRIAEQVLVSGHAARRGQPQAAASILQNAEPGGWRGPRDFTPMDFSAQRDDSPAATDGATKIGSVESRAPAVTVAVDEGGDIAVPDFAGKTMRDVSEMCLRLGLDPVLVGSNLAITQMPAANAKVRRGAKVTVQFGTPTPNSGKPRNGSRN
jgi:hypothetical protein